MSVHDCCHWLVAYDIRCPRRGQRVLKIMKRWGVHLQFSAFLVHDSPARLQCLMRELRAVIVPAVDDVRAYRLPALCEANQLGASLLPEGVLIDERPGPLAARRAALEEVC